MRAKFLTVLLSGFVYCGVSQSAELLTNSAHFTDAPKWLNSTMVNKAADKIGSFLEWDIRRVEVIWYNDQAAFERAHGLGSMVLAVSKKNENKILLGPKITADNFDQIFGHELVHVISYQKYKEAIPKWLEEGLANFIAKASTVDYKFLSSHAFPADVRELVHPFNGSDDHVRYHYFASQALAEMINAKCDFKNLLRLSVGRNLDKYLDSYCGIKDLNQSFHTWVNDHAGKK